MTGERDPLVDDTVIFAGRLRQTKHQEFDHRKEMGLVPSHESFNEKDYVELVLLPGVSHGFLQFSAIYSDAWKHIFRCGRWIEEIFRHHLCTRVRTSHTGPTSSTNANRKLGRRRSTARDGRLYPCW